MGAIPGNSSAISSGSRAGSGLEGTPAAHRHRRALPRPRGGYIDLEKFRWREWTPALRAAGIEHHRVYDLRSTYITWALRQHVPVNVVARAAGTSAKEIEETYDRYMPSDDEYATRIGTFGAVSAGG